MNVKNLSVVLTVLVCATLSWSPAQARHDEALTPEMQAQMAKMKEYSTPGPEHEILKAFEGEWNVSIRSWMKPGDKAETSTGTSSIKWTLDGRFLKQKFKSTWMGQNFEGIGFVGYDKLKKEYVSVWLDNMATGMYQASGQYNPKTRTLSDTGSASCPMTGEKNRAFRDEWKVLNKDNTVFSMYGQDAKGKEFKMMEIRYKRAPQQQ